MPNGGGGLTFPSRYLLAAAPFLALGLGGGLARGGPGFTAAVLTLAGASLWASWQALGDVRQAVGTVAGHAPFLGQSLAWPLQTALFPSLVPPGGLRGASVALPGGEASKTVVWSLVSLAGLVGLLLCKKRPKQAGSALALAAVFVLVLLAAGAAGAFSSDGAWRMSPAQKLNLWERLARTGSRPAVADKPGLEALVIRLDPSALAHAPARPLKSGEALIPARVPKGPLLWGRYLDLPAGRYRVEALCRAMDRGDGPLARLDVAARQGRLILAGAEIKSGQEDMVAMALDFELKEPLPRVEVRLGGAGRKTAIAGLALRRLL